MPEKRRGEKGKSALGEIAGPPSSRAEDELVPMREGRYGAAWFVMLIGLMVTLYFYLALVIFNVVALKMVLDNFEGPSSWVKEMAPWLANNAMLLVLGSVLFLIGYSMTLRRRGRFARERLMLRLFGVGTGLVALAILVVGTDFIFFLPKELKGLSDHLNFFGIQLSTFLVWFAALGAVTVYCWLPRPRGDGGD